MNKTKNKLTKKEKLFCVYFANSADIEQSIKKAGYKKEHYKTALLLLSKNEICEQINRILETRRNVHSNLALSGYERLAFASIKDSVQLLFMTKEELHRLKNLDLYAVSEIKKLKDGGMEIKFFDKLKALEKLSQLSQKEDESGVDFLSALNFSDAKICEHGDDIVEA